MVGHGLVALGVLAVVDPGVESRFVTPTSAGEEWSLSPMDGSETSAAVDVSDPPLLPGRESVEPLLEEFGIDPSSIGGVIPLDVSLVEEALLDDAFDLDSRLDSGLTVEVGSVELDGSGDETDGREPEFSEDLPNREVGIFEEFCLVVDEPEPMKTLGVSSSVDQAALGSRSVGHSPVPFELAPAGLSDGAGFVVDFDPSVLSCSSS